MNFDNELSRISEQIRLGLMLRETARYYLKEMGYDISLDNQFTYDLELVPSDGSEWKWDKVNGFRNRTIRADGAIEVIRK